MKTIDYFKNQLEEAPPLEKDSPYITQGKTFYSGRKMEVGDKILTALLLKRKVEIAMNPPEDILEVILVHPDELDIIYKITEGHTILNTPPLEEIKK